MEIPKEFSRVIIESPYGNKNPELIKRNVTYARACVRDCLMRNESAYASHLLFTQEGILRDEVREERALGMQAGFAWILLSDKTVVYTDFGISPGMEEGIKCAQALGHKIEHRTLPKEDLEKILLAYPT